MRLSVVKVRLLKPHDGYKAGSVLTMDESKYFKIKAADSSSIALIAGEPWEPLPPPVPDYYMEEE